MSLFHKHEWRLITSMNVTGGVWEECRTCHKRLSQAKTLKRLRDRTRQYHETDSAEFDAEVRKIERVAKSDLRLEMNNPQHYLPYACGPDGQAMYCKCGSLMAHNERYDQLKEGIIH